MHGESLIIHGDKLAKVCAEDDKKQESEKGLTLQMWLSKKEVCFARTTPA